MKVQAINSAMSTRSCQPIKPVRFEGEAKRPSFAKEVFSDDVYSPEATIEEKYDMACLLAGYYKTQYESLLKNGNCVA